MRVFSRVRGPDAACDDARAIDSYPWRDRSTMRTRLPWLTATYLGATTPAAIAAFTTRSTPSSPLREPSPDCDHAIVQARKWLGRDPRGVMELCEEVHRRVTLTGRTSQCNAVLTHDRLFLY